jgi:hypothetical protein
LPVLSLACALLLACAGRPGSVAADRRGQVDGQAFELSTGGSGFLEAHGQWIVRVRGDAMWVSETKGEKSKEYGTYTLSKAESSKLWQLVDGARLHKRPEAQVESPDVNSFSFTILKPKKLAHTVTLSMQATNDDEKLVELVVYVEELARKYTRKKAVFVPAEGEM